VPSPAIRLGPSPRGRTAVPPLPGPPPGRRASFDGPRGERSYRRATSDRLADLLVPRSRSNVGRLTVVAFCDGRAAAFGVRTNDRCGCVVRAPRDTEGGADLCVTDGRLVDGRDFIDCEIEDGLRIALELCRDTPREARAGDACRRDTLRAARDGDACRCERPELKNDPDRGDVARAGRAMLLWPRDARGLERAFVERCNDWRGRDTDRPADEVDRRAADAPLERLEPRFRWSASARALTVGQATSSAANTVASRHLFGGDI